MPKFLEKKLKEQYGQNSNIPYKIMNKMGVMHGNKTTSKGRAMEEKHNENMAHEASEMSRPGSILKRALRKKK